MENRRLLKSRIDYTRKQKKKSKVKFSGTVKKYSALEKINASLMHIDIVSITYDDIDVVYLWFYCSQTLLGYSAFQSFYF